MANGFRLTLDTLKPTGAISSGDHKYTNSNFDLTITNTGNSAKFMKIWFDESDTTSTVPSSLTWIDISSKGASFTQTTAFTSETGTFYYHLILMDEVNNESDIYHTESIIRDTAAPDVTNVWVKDPDSGSTAITNNRTGNYFGFSYDTPGLAPVKKAVISCPDFTSDVTITNPETPYDSSTKDPKGTVSFKASAVDGPKTITVTITDACGNTKSNTGSIDLDTTLGDLTMTLYKVDGTTALPEKINYSNIKVGLVSEASDIVAYKLWEDGQTEPDWTTMTKGKLDVKLAFALSSGDATKTLKAKIKDEAGSITEPPVNKSVLVDYTVPVISVTSDKTWIAGPDGSDEGTIKSATLTLTHDESISGLQSWDLKCGNTSIKGSLTTIPATFTLTYANSMVRGANTISFIVTDQAGNTATSTVTVNLDDQKPAGEINSLSTWYNNWQNFTCSLSNVSDSGAGLDKIYVWTNTTQVDTTVPSGTTAISISTSTITVPSDKINGTPAQSAANYIHVQIVDKVGHVYYPTAAKYGFDNVAPTVCTAAFSRTSYNTTTASIKVTVATDATSGVKEIKITGDVTKTGGVNPGEWFTLGTVPQDISVTLTANAAASSVENKTVTIYLKDNAGNESAVLSTITTELDQTIPGANLVLRTATDSAAQPIHVVVSKFAARVSGFDDGTAGAKASEYKLYGDFTYNSQSASGITEQAAAWETLTYGSGVNYKLVQEMYCTSNPTGTTAEVKHIYLKVRDDAGNESQAATQTFTYDTAIPEVSITTNPEFYIVSKVHALRRNTSGEIAGKYADEETFAFTPNETIQAYKVCAYKDLDDAKWKDAGKTEARDPAEETPIPTTAGSTNMSATGLDTSTAITSMIKGADYETALVARGLEAGKTAEGAHVVVVYVQDLAGQWSALANFTI